MHFRQSIFISSLLITFLLLSISSCSSNGNGKEVDRDAGETITGESGSDENSTVVGNDERDSSSAGENANAMMEPGDLDSIEGYGSFIFPDAEFLAEDSSHQELFSGGEIYNLQFGVEVNRETVVDWYEDNMEDGAVFRDTNLPNGSSVTVIEYENEQPRYSKTITVSSPPGTSVSIIKVRLMKWSDFEMEQN